MVQLLVLSSFHLCGLCIKTSVLIQYEPKTFRPDVPCDVCFTALCNVLAMCILPVEHTSHDTSGRNLFWIMLNKNRCLYTQPTQLKVNRNWKLSQLVTDVLIYNTRTLWLRIHNQGDLWSMYCNTPEYCKLSLLSVLCCKNFVYFNKLTF